MNASDVAFTLQFQLTNSPEDCDFTDTTNYAVPPSGTPAVDPDYVTGYLKIESPTGLLVNDLNTGANVGSPTIYRKNTDEKIDIALPLDASGDVETGTYTVTYQSRVWDDEITPYTIVSITSSTKTITVSGTAAAAAITAIIGKYFLIDGTANNDKPVTVVSATINGGNTDIVVSESLTDEVPGAGIFYSVEKYTDYQSVKTVVYDYTAPTADLDVSHSCKLATLTATDDTDYRAINNGSYVSASSSSRTITLTAPVNPDGSGFSPTTTTTSNSTITLSNIYTGDWTIGLLTSVTFTIDSWLIIADQVQGLTSHEVDCDDCGCTYYTCIANLLTNYYTYINTNDPRKRDVKGYLEELTFNWMLYNMAEQCGYDSTAYCEKIQQLAQADECQCSTSDGDTTLSVPVVPYGSGSGSTTVVGSKWYNDSGVPLSSLGSDDDYYLNDDNGDYYKKISGSWVYQGTLKPTTGTWLNGASDPTAGTGSVGDFYINLTTKEYFKKTGTTTWTSQGFLSGFVKLHADISDSDCAAAATQQTLKTYTFPANLLDTEGDEVLIEAYFESNTGTGDRTMYIDFGSTTIATVTYSPASVAHKTNIKGKIEWESASSEVYRGWIEDVTGSMPMSITGGQIASMAEDETTTNSIRVRCQTTDGGAADITCKNFNVYLIKK